MDINELIEKLEEIRDSYDEGGEMKIVVALQPNYPLVGSLLNICTEASKNRVWLAVSNGEGYGVPQEVWDDDEIYED